MVEVYCKSVCPPSARYRNSLAKGDKRGERAGKGRKHPTASSSTGTLKLLCPHQLRPVGWVRGETRKRALRTFVGEHHGFPRAVAHGRGLECRARTQLCIKSKSVVPRRTRRRRKAAAAGGRRRRQRGDYLPGFGLGFVAAVVVVVVVAVVQGVNRRRSR